VFLCSREEAFSKDIVLVLRSPKPETRGLIPPGTILVSMLHYPTRPQRVEDLKEHGIRAISLDSIENDSGLRLVENMKAVAWNGLEAAFDVLEKCWPGLANPTGEPVKVLILGAGMVGKHAVEAATKLGNLERNAQHLLDGGPGAVAMTVGRNVSANPVTMKQLFSQADILVDATQRRDPSVPLVSNEWIGWLPEHAVIVDLAVDPYSLSSVPVVVRGIEGIPQGDLDQYTFFPNDPHWFDKIPASIPSENRRATVTCYSWPGIHPEACMRHYAQQLEPLMEALVAKGYDGLSPEGSYFERGLYRATLKSWLKSTHHAVIQAG
jgi:alanine dehydrogenase